MEITQMTTDPTRFFPSLGSQAVDAGHLEMLGKQAATLAETGSLSLSDAVVRLIGQEKLSSEQVRRVVEFANTEAFNRKFSSLDPHNRVVDIEGGPADPNRVLQELNDKARPEHVQLQSLDYDMPPEPKVAHDIDFGLGPAPAMRTRAGVLQEIYDLRSKLSSAQEEAVQSAESARYQMGRALEDLQAAVKTASFEGLHREDLIRSWSEMLLEEPDLQDLVKTAMEYMPNLPSRGSTKVAARVNPHHPVRGHFLNFVKFASQYATFTAARQNLERRLVDVDAFLRGHSA